MNWFSALLPVWIIGAPLAYGVFDWMRTPRTVGAVQTYDVRRPMPAAAA